MPLVTALSLYWKRLLTFPKRGRDIEHEGHKYAAPSLVPNERNKSICLQPPLNRKPNQSPPSAEAPPITGQLSNSFEASRPFKSPFALFSLSSNTR